ncbi:hypothetical protein Tsubulata_018267 [Turnera subulata]|uniref:Uncharacterized protein n=1 Tax=Turnera subulata TaxID=218843 RepID=A0A9Q0GA57_9ROSI|nr:hypothetical protein Tsubulata_018267 [Turnera subulata]
MSSSKTSPWPLSQVTRKQQQGTTLASCTGDVPLLRMELVLATYVRIHRHLQQIQYNNQKAYTCCILAFKPDTKCILVNAELVEVPPFSLQLVEAPPL